MKVVMIDGSPRTPANTTQLLDLLQGELAPGTEVDRIKIANFRVAPCKGCEECEKGHKCSTEDDMASLLARTEAADIIVLGSPTYFGTISGTLKAFIDRTVPAYWEERLAGKAGGWIVTQAESAGMLAEHTLDEVCRQHGMLVVGGILCTGAAAGEAVANESNITAVKKLAGKFNRYLSMAARK